MHNIAKDKSSEARTLRTTDELYISALYFTAADAALIGGTIVEVEEVIAYADLDATDRREGEGEEMTIEEAIKGRLERCFEKRRASGDSRPCGPHDLAPIYEVFGILRSGILGEGFLGRLRSGLGDGARLML